MHEVSLVQALLSELADYAGRDILAVQVEIGALSCADPERLKFCFEMVKEGTFLASSRLDIKQTAARAKCRQCAKEFKLNFRGEPCDCGSYDYTLLTGDEVLITEIEYL